MADPNANASPRVPEAIQHLVAHLRHRQDKGEKRAYLTAEAKAGLRSVYQHVRQARQRPAATATPAASSSPPSTPAVDMAASKPVEPIENQAPEASASSPASAYPPIATAAARLTLELKGADKAAQLADLKSRIAEDREARTSQLRDTMVFSVGNLDAEIMFIGEAPGSEEERQEEPFVGPAGQLLTKIIQAMGLQREMVYISNIVKYRPGMPNQGTGNRKPTTEEMQACLPYVMAETKIVQPKVIVALGGTALEGLTGEKTPVGRARDQVRSWNGIPFVVTVSPFVPLAK